MAKILQIIPATSSDWVADSQPVLGWALIEEGVGERAVVPLVPRGGKLVIAEAYQGICVDLTLRGADITKVNTHDDELVGESHRKAKPVPKEKLS